MVAGINFILHPCIIVGVGISQDMTTFKLKKHHSVDWLDLVKGVRPNGLVLTVM